METNLVVNRDEWFYYELNTYVNPCNFAVFEEDDSSFYIEEREVQYFELHEDFKDYNYVNQWSNIDYHFPLNYTELAYGYCGDIEYVFT